MLLARARAQDVFRKVRNVQDHLKAYCLGHDRPDLSVEDLQRVIEDMYSIKINKSQVPFEGTFLSGLTERHKGTANIFIKKNMDEDAKRFAAIKELCHVIIDEEEDWSSEGSKTITTLLVEISIVQGDIATTVSQSETLAEVAAIELAYPYSVRIGDREAIKNGKLTPVKIAIVHKLPESIISRALADRYHELIGSIWDDIA